MSEPKLNLELRADPMPTEFQSASVAKLGAALAKAQGEIKGAKKDSQNPFFKSSYADLASVWEACREALTKNELSVVQSTVYIYEKVFVRTILLHSSGEWIAGLLPVFLKATDPQSLGSGITYTRRYALAAMVGVAPNDDDDAEAAMTRTADAVEASQPKIKVLSTKIKGSMGPRCCDDTMMVNVYNEAEWYCKKCKKRLPRGEK